MVRSGGSLRAPANFRHRAASVTAMAHSWHVDSPVFAIVRRLTDLPFQFVIARRMGLGGVPKLEYWQRDHPETDLGWLLISRRTISKKAFNPDEQHW